MTTEERLENLERELARAKRRNRWLLICAAVCLGLIFAWVLFAQPGLLGTAQASDPANPYEAEIARLQAEVNLLKRENDRLQKELDEAKKDKSAAAPTDAQEPSAPQPATAQPPDPDEPPTAIRIPGLPETDSSWWRDPTALVKHMQLRVAMSATNPQASVGMWLQRHKYFAGQSVQWKVEFLKNEMNSRYIDKDAASIEYYKCLGLAKTANKNARTTAADKAAAERYGIEEGWFEGEARAWKILMDAGGGLSLRGWAKGAGGPIDGLMGVHLVLPGARSATAYFGTPLNRMVLVQGKIVVLGADSGTKQAALTCRVSSLSAD